MKHLSKREASTNPANPGGPLLNSAGEIIGINTAIVAPAGGNVGIGFAIPVDTVKRITKDLITLGYVPHAYLGVANYITLQDVPWLANALRLSTDRGLMVVGVLPNSAAAAGGIRGASEQVRVGRYIMPVGGDVILAFEGKPVNSPQEIATEIDRHKPGDKVTVTVLRGGRKIDVPIVLREAPRQ